MAEFGRKFWSSAWNIAEQLRGDADIAPELYQELSDLNMQAYLFTWQKIDTPVLLDALIFTPLFDQPPDGHWPLVDYLASQALEQPDSVAYALSRAASSAGSNVLQ